MVVHRKHYETIPRRVKVLFGTLSGIAASTSLHPVDVIKVRIQLNPEEKGSKVIRRLVQQEGFKTLYAGFSAGVLRQLCYTSTRLGAHFWLHERHSKKHGRTPSLASNVRYGIYAGLLGAFTGCPVDIVLVRMIADGTNKQTRRYTGIRDAFSKIIQDEGVRGLWRGGMLGLIRSVCFSVVQIGSYTQIHELLAEKKPKAKDLRLHVYTSLISSFITSIISLPVDNVKTRYQAITEHVSELSIFNNILQKGGVLGFWRGFVPYYIRLSCHTITTFYVYEKLIKMYQLHRSYAENEKEK